MTFTKWAALSVALTLVMGLSACGNDTTPSDGAETTTTAITTTTASTDGTTTTAPTDNSTTATTASTTKATTTTVAPTTTTVAKLDYLVREEFVYSYHEPVVKTDYETKEEYYEMRYVYVSFHPNGTTVFDFGVEEEVTYAKPVLDFSVREYVLVPETDIPKCLEYVPEYILSYLEQYTWEQLFDHADELPEEYKIVEMSGKKYLEFVPPVGGFYEPVYSYTIDNTNGNVALKKENQAEGDELLSVDMKLGAQSIAIRYKMQSKEYEAELTGKKLPQ